MVTKPPKTYGAFFTDIYFLQSFAETYLSIVDLYHCSYIFSKLERVAQEGIIIEEKNIKKSSKILKKNVGLF